MRKSEQKSLHATGLQHVPNLLYTITVILHVNRHYLQDEGRGKGEECKDVSFPVATA